MPILPTLLSRRFEAREIDNTQQIIAFILARDWFALPILEIQKVIPLETIAGDSGDRGIGITIYEDREVLIVDVAKQIFNQSSTPRQREATTERSPSRSTSTIESYLSNDRAQRYLVLLKDEADNIVGLPIDSQPVMYRVHPSDFKSLPETYLASGNIQCISSQIIDLPDRPLIFLLNRQQLIESLIPKTRNED